MKLSAPLARWRAKNFHGSLAVFLGAWEALAFRGLLPTITAVARRYPRARPIVALWLLSLARHLLARA